MKVAVKMQIKKTRRMKKLLRVGQAALQEKAKECEMLEKMKQSMLAKKAAKEKMVADFMLFIEAIEKKDAETAQNFDEKVMKDTILSMMKDGQDHSGRNGGFASDNGGKEA